LATADLLHAEILCHRSDALLCPNAVDFQFFSVARDRNSMEVPEDIQPFLADGVPVIGYYGAMASWFDYFLVEQLAALRPDYNFILIGPDYVGSLQKESFFQRQNIHWLDKKPYAELPKYLSFFDVAFIPFVVNEITNATSPLKLFEYMAGGKPVVITQMEESMHYPGVFVGRNPEEFASCIDHALKMSSNSDYLKKIDAFARSNTWGDRAKVILEKIISSDQIAKSRDLLPKGD